MCKRNDPNVQVIAAFQTETAFQPLFFPASWLTSSFAFLDRKWQQHIWERIGEFLSVYTLDLRTPFFAFLDTGRKKIILLNFGCLDTIWEKSIGSKPVKIFEIPEVECSSASWFIDFFLRIFYQNIVLYSCVWFTCSCYIVANCECFVLDLFHSK